MTATLKLPRVLTDVVGAEPTHDIEGSNLAAVLGNLFVREPGLRTHVVDEQGAIRPHVAIFVDGVRAQLETSVGTTAEIWIIQAVSGGSAAEME